MGKKCRAMKKRAEKDAVRAAWGDRCHRLPVPVATIFDEREGLQSWKSSPKLLRLLLPLRPLLLLSFLPLLLLLLLLLNDVVTRNLKTVRTQPCRPVNRPRKPRASAGRKLMSSHQNLHQMNYISSADRNRPRIYPNVIQ